MTEALWVIAICSLILTFRVMWTGFWDWYAHRMKYSSKEPRLLRVVYKVLYGREL
jgi:hypothetical protein